MKARILSLCRIIGLGVAATFLAAAAASPQASAPDVGLITQISGAVTYWNKEEQKEPAPAQAFMKVRQGDNFKLKEAGSLTLLYFASGRQETWRGPVTLRAADTESTAVGAGKSPPLPEVKLIPTKATKQIQGAPLPLPGPSISKSGVIQTMGPKCEPAAGTPAPLSAEARRNIKEAEKVFQELKKSAAADDVTPELYFLSILNEYKQFPEMAKVVDTMLQKRPGDVALKDLKVWVRSQSAARD
jgi:hypothetical protein